MLKIGILLQFGAKLYLEETGMFRDGKPLILFLPQTEKQPEFLNELNNNIYSGNAVIKLHQIKKHAICNRDCDITFSQSRIKHYMESNH